MGRSVRHASPRWPSRLRQPRRAVPLPVGRQEPLHRPALPGPETGARRPGQPNLERRCGRVLPGHPAWRQTRRSGIRSRHTAYVLHAVHEDRRASPGSRSVICRRSRTSSCRGPRLPPPRRRGATPPNSSCRGRTSRTSRPMPARSSASSASYAAATAGHGWIARSSIPAPLPSVRRPLSGGCNSWTRSTPAP